MEALLLRASQAAWGLSSRDGPALRWLYLHSVASGLGTGVESDSPTLREEKGNPLPLPERPGKTLCSFSCRLVIQ